MHSSRINSTKILQEMHSRTLLLLFSLWMVFSSSFFYTNNLFLQYVLIWSKIDPKWFCLWGKQTEKIRTAMSGRGGKVSVADFSRCHGNRTFKEFWWEQQAKRGWLQGRQFVTPLVRLWLHTHTSNVVYSFIWITVLSHHGPSVRGCVRVVSVL